MQDEQFEWDDAKAVANLLKHGVDFDDASLIFGDKAARVRPDARRDYREDRFIRTGRAKDLYLTVVYTVRAGRVRIISARLASKTERSSYHE
jgi:uncharacterized DUF497 family protein